jgi:hypothetical protein
MATLSRHCPFLNRADARCSESFSLDNLDNAFSYCFGRYKTCRVYLELLMERRLKRSDAPGETHDAAPIIQVTTRRKAADANNQSSAAGVPALPGVGARAG